MESVEQDYRKHPATRGKLTFERAHDCKTSEGDPEGYKNKNLLWNTFNPSGVLTGWYQFGFPKLGIFKMNLLQFDGVVF